MKYYIILFTILVTTSCKKEFHFKNNEITERDAQGNLVGNINTNDWVLKKVADASDFDRDVFNKVYTDSGSFNINIYKKSCPLPDTFNIISYPNPMNNSNCFLNHKVTKSVNFNYDYGYEIIVKKDGTIISTSGVPSLPEWKSKINALTFRDFIYYVIFVTPDSCAYFTKGNVIGCTN